MSGEQKGTRRDMRDSVACMNCRGDLDATIDFDCRAAAATLIVLRRAPISG